MSVLSQSGNSLPKMGLPISKADDSWIGLRNTVKLHMTGWEGRHRDKKAEKDNFGRETQTFPFKAPNNTAERVF